MEIQIVKYDESYAAKVADMWNHSRDGWGGSNAIETEETIRNREANSTNIHTFLALEGELVVGYCGFSEYRDDEGALYIPLLNVRDAYHGKKIGKKLLLHALQEAIDLKWPRLDLYTWPGNTKAVPLYKKCGFFWEDRDDTTHLMNFMPTVLHTEVVKDFFSDGNWYDMSTRQIEVKPDGRVENDFHYFEYSWQKDEQSLRIEIERSSRGIRLIETDDYYISAKIAEHRLVFGNEYNIIYSIKNKSGRPLDVDLKGVRHKNIEFSFEQSLKVEDEAVVTGSFFVGAVTEEQDNFKTHPAVVTEVTINGKKAVFKLGILPKYPAQVTAILPNDLTFIEKETVFYLDVMNNFREEVTFTIDFPKADILELIDQKLTLKIEPLARVSVPVAFLPKKYGYYKKELTIKATKENGEEVQFTKEVSLALRGIGAKFFGDDDERVQLFNGQYFATLSKRGNTIFTGRKRKEEGVSILTPKLGKPYSEELAKVKPQTVQFFEDSGVVGFKASYELTAFPAIKLHLVGKLYGDGLFENYYEVENKQENPTEKPVWLTQSIFLGLEKATIPYEGSVLTMNDSVGSAYGYWESSKITENWLFVEDNRNPLGVCWNPEVNIQFGSWFHYFESNMGVIAGKAVVTTKPVYVSIGAFHDSASFRAYALQSYDEKRVITDNHFTIFLENQNPFVVDDQVTFKVRDYKNTPFHGEMAVSFSGQKEAFVTGKFNREEEKTEWTGEVSLSNAPAVSVLKATSKVDAVELERETLVIKQKPVGMKEKVVQEQGFDTWVLENGVLEIKASPDYFPVLHSLKLNGHEWLDSYYPELKPRVWWNPWTGGIYSGLSAMKPYSLTKEKSVAKFTSLTDNKGNQWRGIKLSTSIQQNEEYKGLDYHQYFLLLPGTPVLCHVSEVVQNTGKFFDNTTWQTGGFFKTAQNIEDNWAQFQDQEGRWTKVVAGKGEHEGFVDRNLIIGGNGLDEHIQIITDNADSARDTYINKEVLESGVWQRLKIPSGQTQFTVPIFYVFTNNIIDDAAQKDLKKIRFVDTGTGTLSTQG